MNRRIAPWLGLALACACTPDRTSDRSSRGTSRTPRTAEAHRSPPTFTIGTTALDSLSASRFDPQLATAVALDDSTFAVASHADDPVCVLTLPSGGRRCRAVRGGGPGEVTSVEQVAVWPGGRVAVWDMQTGRLGVWDRALRAGATVRVVNPAVESFRLFGIQADSVVVIGRGVPFRQMPEGAFPIPSTIERWRNGTLLRDPHREVRGSWISVAAVGAMRGGMSLPGNDEELVSVTADAVRIIDARDCTVSAFAAARPVPRFDRCEGAPGFRDTILKQIAVFTGPVGQAHQARVRSSTIPERYVGISDAMDSYSTGEIAIRTRRRVVGDAWTWTFALPDAAPHVTVRIDSSWRLIGFSTTYLLLVRRDTDDIAAPSTLYWTRRDRLIRTD